MEDAVRSICSFIRIINRQGKSGAVRTMEIISKQKQITGKGRGRRQESQSNEQSRSRQAAEESEVSINNPRSVTVQQTQGKC